MRAKIGVLFLVSVVFMLTTPFIGATEISISRIFASTLSDSEAQIFWEIRVPRVIFGFLAGVGLAAAGVVFQSIFRNSLASPFTLGVSSAASFGAALSIKFGAASSFFGAAGPTISAFLAALLSVLVILGLSSGKRSVSEGGLLLCGVALSLFFSSLVVVLQYLGTMGQLFSITRFLMGSFDLVGYDAVKIVFPFVAVGVVISILLSRGLDLLSIGDQFAQTRGLSPRVVRNILIVTISLVVAVIISICGVVGFVGIIVPHMARQMVGATHKNLLVASLLLGGSLLLLCDTIGRVVLAPAEIPVGVITSLIGGPFFLWLVLRSQSRL